MRPCDGCTYKLCSKTELPCVECSRVYRDLHTGEARDIELDLIAESICEEYCRFCRMPEISEEELIDICDNCPVGKI